MSWQVTVCHYGFAKPFEYQAFSRKMLLFSNPDESQLNFALAVGFFDGPVTFESSQGPTEL